MDGTRFLPFPLAMLLITLARMLSKGGNDGDDISNNAYVLQSPMFANTSWSPWYIMYYLVFYAMFSI